MVKIEGSIPGGYEDRMVCRFKNSSPVKIMQTVWIILNQAVHQPWAPARLSAVEVDKALLGRGGPLAGPFQTLIYSHPRK